jgi:hypothetical protein
MLPSTKVVRRSKRGAILEIGLASTASVPSTAEWLHFPGMKLSGVCMTAAQSLEE